MLRPFSAMACASRPSNRIVAAGRWRVGIPTPRTHQFVGGSQMVWAHGSYPTPRVHVGRCVKEFGGRHDIQRKDMMAVVVRLQS